MTVFQGIFRSEGTREGRGQQQNQYPQAPPVEVLDGLINPFLSPPNGPERHSTLSIKERRRINILLLHQVHLPADYRNLFRHHHNTLAQ